MYIFTENLDTNASCEWLAQFSAFVFDDVEQEHIHALEIRTNKNGADWFAFDVIGRGNDGEISSAAIQLNGAQAKALAVFLLKYVEEEGVQ